MTATIPKLISEYDKSIKAAIKKLKNFDPGKLQADHKQLIKSLTSKFSDPEKSDITDLLDTRWCNMIECEEFKTWQKSDKNVGTHLFLYFLSHWVYVAAYTKKLGYVDITFGSQQVTKAGFPGYVSRSKGKLNWGFDYDRNTLTDEEKTKYRLVNRIEDASRGNKESKELVSELLRRVKKFTEEMTKEKIATVFVVTNLFRISFLSPIRACCKDAGLKKVLIFGDSALAAFHHFKLLPTTCEKMASVATVNLVNGKDMRVDIFAGHQKNGKIVGVKHVAAASGTYNNKDTLNETARQMYERALGQMSVCSRKSLSHYIVLPSSSGDWKTLLDTPNKQVQLTNLRIVTSDHLLDVFSHLLNDKLDKLSNFLDISVSQNNIALDHSKPSKPVASDLKYPTTKCNAPVNWNNAKLILQIKTVDGKEYRLHASGDWTVGKLKKKFHLISGLQNSVPFDFRCSASSVADDDMYLSSSKLDPESILQAHLDRIKIVSEVNSRKTGAENLNGCRLIANCVVKHRGSEHEYVEGIKQGQLVLARTDLENLTLGEVGVTCSIDGIEDQIYVGVKFRKHLPLGSTRIEHVGGGENQCDECKGRKCLFIPLDLIGPSKDYLFEVQ